MANHCMARMPWDPDWDVAEAFAKESMRACFGPAFILAKPEKEQEEDEGRRWWVFESPGGDHLQAALWSPAPRSLEIRRNARGLAAAAIDMALNGTAAAFGAFKGSDEGIGGYPIGELGELSLTCSRMLYSGGGHWSFEPAVADKLALEMDPAFFRKVAENEFVCFAQMLSQNVEEDRVLWGARLDWAAALKEAWGGEKAPSSKAANSAALPFCAYGMDLPEWVAQQMTLAGAQRALGVALARKGFSASKSIASRFEGVDVDAAKAWALTQWARAHKSNSSPQKAAESVAGIAQFAEALSLQREAPKAAKAAKAKRM